MKKCSYIQKMALQHIVVVILWLKTLSKKR